MKTKDGLAILPCSDSELGRLRNLSDEALVTIIPLVVEVRVPERPVAPQRVFFVTASLVNRASRAYSVNHLSPLLTLRVYKDGEKVFPEIDLDYDLDGRSHVIQPGEYYGGLKVPVDGVYFFASEVSFPVVLEESGTYQVVANAYIETTEPPIGYTFNLYSDSVAVVIE